MVSILHIKVTAANIHWHVIVAVARDAAEFGILARRVTSSPYPEMRLKKSYALRS